MIEGQRCIFRHINSGIHIQQRDKQCFADNNIDVLYWPTHSPDLNMTVIVGNGSRKNYSECRRQKKNLLEPQNKNKKILKMLLEIRMTKGPYLNIRKNRNFYFFNK